MAYTVQGSGYEFRLRCKVRTYEEVGCGSFRWNVQGSGLTVQGSGPRV